MGRDKGAEVAFALVSASIPVELRECCLALHLTSLQLFYCST